MVLTKMEIHFLVIGSRSRTYRSSKATATASDNNHLSSLGELGAGGVNCWINVSIGLPSESIEFHIAVTVKFIGSNIHSFLSNIIETDMRNVNKKSRKLQELRSVSPDIYITLPFFVISLSL